MDKPSLSSFQASKQAGKGTEIKRVQPGGTCMALQPHSRRRLIFQLDLRHVKSHLWLFVNCPLAELCKAHWEGPLGRPTGKAHWEGPLGRPTTVTKKSLRPDRKSRLRLSDEGTDDAQGEPCELCCHVMSRCYTM